MKYFSFLRTLALVLALSLGSVARAEGEDGGTEPAKIIRLPSNQYLVNEAAFKAIDFEVSRLQQVERNHKAESWLQVVLLSALVGLILGIPTGIGLGFLFK